MMGVQLIGPRWLALGVLTLARVSMGFQFQSVASAAVPLRDAMALSYADIGFLIGVYFSPGIVLALPGGVLGPRFGDKRMVCVGLFLMILGAATMAVATEYQMLVAGRLMSGVGGVLLNVLMSKMIADWFSGRGIVLAMAIFVNSFPIGIGLALLVLGWVVPAAGWPAAMSSAGILAGAALALVIICYQRHPNDQRSATTVEQPARITKREMRDVGLAGTIWGLFNGAHAILLGFTPILLIQRGYSSATSGVLVGLSTWLVVASVLVGGAVVQRWGHDVLLFVASVVLSIVCLAALPLIEPVAPLMALGAAFGLPAGIITALPAALLRPEVRSVGMGVFFTGLYVGHAALPALAGRLQDISGNPGTSVYFGAVVVLAMLGAFAALKLLQRSAAPADAIAH
jgi:cyanate permease